MERHINTNWLILLGVPAFTKSPRYRSLRPVFEREVTIRVRTTILDDIPPVASSQDTTGVLRIVPKVEWANLPDSNC